VEQGAKIEVDYSLLVRLSVELDNESLMRRTDDYTLPFRSNVSDIICNLRAITQSRDTIGDEVMNKACAEITSKLIQHVENTSDWYYSKGMHSLVEVGQVLREKWSLNLLNHLPFSRLSGDNIIDFFESAGDALW